MHDPTTLTAPPQLEPPHPKASLAASESETMARWIQQDLASGKMTQAQADAIFNDLQTPLEHRLPDTRTEEQKTLDQYFPAAKPEEFVIRYGEGGQEPAMTPEMKQFDQSARMWLSEGQFPRDLGNSLVNAIEKTVQATSRMNENELENYGHREFEKLQRVHGEKLEERLQAAAMMIDHLERQRPGLKALLASKGIGDDAMVANTLIQHAAVWHAKRGR